MLLPLLTEVDPRDSGEGSIDPLGTYAIADALATGCGGFCGVRRRVSVCAASPDQTRGRERYFKLAAPCRAVIPARLTSPRALAGRRGRGRLSRSGVSLVALYLFRTRCPRRFDRQYSFGWLAPRGAR